MMQKQEVVAKSFRSGVRGLSDTRSQTEQTEYQKSYVCRTHVPVQTDTTDHAMPSSPNAVLSLPAGRGACGSQRPQQKCVKGAEGPPIKRHESVVSE